MKSAVQMQRLGYAVLGSEAFGVIFQELAVRVSCFSYRELHKSRVQLLTSAVQTQMQLLGSAVLRISCARIREELLRISCARIREELLGSSFRS